jgi:Domain of unknown function (DUF6268)
MGGPGGGPGGPGYSATWYPSRPVLGGGFGGLPSSVGLVRQSVNAGVPLWMSPPDMLMLTTNVRHTLFQTDAVLPDTGRPFPDQLWSVNVGLMYLRKLENGWSVGGMFGFGSSSDRPFNSVREMNLSALVFLNMPAFEGRDSWRFSVIYSPVGALNFPIPGISYQWNPSERLSVGLGLPLSVNWRPTGDWTLTASYIPLTNVNARITRRITDEWKVYAGYEWLNESYFLVDRANAADRFIGLEQRVIGGLTYALGERLTLDLNAGYAFNRQYGEGANLGGSLRDRIDVRGGAFLGASLRMRF